MKTKAIIFPLILCLGIYGCAGRTPNPVIAQQYGDEKKSCSAIQKELTFIESEIKRMMPESDKTGQNVALGVAGVFLLVPWFFMDFSDADKVEINAYRRRYNQLVILADEKKCGFDYQPIPDFRMTQGGAHEDQAGAAPQAVKTGAPEAGKEAAAEPSRPSVERKPAPPDNPRPAHASSVPASPEESDSPFPSVTAPNNPDNMLPF